VGLLVPTSGALPPAAVAFADIARALLAQGR